MIFLQFLDPLAVCLFVSLVWEILVGFFAVTVLEAMALGMPLIAGYNAGRVERRGRGDNLVSK
jgi:hypothetical protein